MTTFDTEPGTPSPATVRVGSRDRGDAAAPASYRGRDLIGRTVDGRYRALSLLSSQQQVAIFEAQHVSLGRRVALRVLRPDALSLSAHNRFNRGARALGVLHGIHVTKVCDAGVLASGQPYLVTELTQGQLLSDWLRRDRLLSVADAAGLTIQLCEALSEAHQKGIVHRNLTPQAVLLTEYAGSPPRVRLHDFRLALLVDEPPQSRPSLVGGQAASYQSPEQEEHPNQVDARADIWSLGALLYEMVAGTPLPFRCAPDPAAVSTALESLSGSDELRTVLRRCLEPDPERRYATVEELAADLRPVAAAPPSRAAERSGSPRFPQ